MLQKFPEHNTQQLPKLSAGTCSRQEREKYHFVCLLSLLPTRSQQGQHFAPLLERHTGEMSEADTLSLCSLFSHLTFSQPDCGCPISLEGWHRMAFCCAFLLLFLTCQSPSFKCHKSNYFEYESWQWLHLGKQQKDSFSKAGRKTRCFWWLWGQISSYQLSLCSFVPFKFMGVCCLLVFPSKLR